MSRFKCPDCRTAHEGHERSQGCLSEVCPNCFDAREAGRVVADPLTNHRTRKPARKVKPRAPKRKRK